MALINSPDNFNTDTNSLTEFRVKLIMNYIIHCYLEMVKDVKKRSEERRVGKEC